MIRKTLLAVISVIALFGFSQIANAQVVSVNPKRVVFDGRERVKEVFLLNSGNEETTYRVYFEETAMQEDGSVKKIEEENIPKDHRSIKDMIRYSPRQVTIPPRGSQIIRLMLRKKGDTQEGEYRSNIVFRNVPKELGENLDSAIAKEGEFGVKITPIFGISIPVIVRHGELNATPSISDVKLVKEKDGRQKVELNLHRQGDRSLYGHFKVNYIPPSGDKPIQVGVVKGIAAYDNIKKRPVVINLNVPEGVKLKKGGTLKVSFDEDRDMGGSASSELSIII